MVEASSIFKVIYPVQWGLVCFQLKSGNNKDHENLARELKRNQETLITTSTWKGSTYLRATFNQFMATENDVVEIFHIIQNRAQFLFEKSNQITSKIPSKAILKNDENIAINLLLYFLVLFFEAQSELFSLFIFGSFSRQCVHLS